MNNTERKLYLIPTLLGESAPERVIPTYNLDIIRSIRFFVVEEERTARRFLAGCGLKDELPRIQFFLLNEHTPAFEIPGIFSSAGASDIGMISEAGVPGVADPGAILVEEAHRLNVKVIPLVGPSSLLLALMASGLNGQQFAFNGYLPVKSHERMARIKHFEKRSETENQSQIFIEAPYRNNQLIQAFLETCKPATRLCIASNITLSNEWIKTKTIRDWRITNPPDLKKQPVVFILQA
ncbi:MAG: SAM-dependent methyltransferase [Bacteroidales bacterium]